MLYGRGVAVRTKTDRLRLADRIPLSFVEQRLIILPPIDDKFGLMGGYIFMKKTLTEQKFMSPFSLEYWKVALSEVGNVRTLAICAVLIAMRVALKNVRIPLGENLNVYIGFLVNAVSGAICGPVLSLVGGAVCDILGFYLSAQTGGFIPVFTLIEMLCAFLFSICLYRTKITPAKIFLSKFLVNFIGNITLTSLAMNAYYGKGVYAYMLPRIAKNILMLPIEVMFLVFIFNAVTPMLTRMKLVPSPQAKMEVNVVKYIIVIVLTVLAAVLTYFFYDELYAAFKTFIDNVYTSLRT